MIESPFFGLICILLKAIALIHYICYKFVVAPFAEIILYSESRVKTSKINCHWITHTWGLKVSINLFWSTKNLYSLIIQLLETFLQLIVGSNKVYTIISKHPVDISSMTSSASSWHVSMILGCHTWHCMAWETYICGGRLHSLFSLSTPLSARHVGKGTFRSSGLQIDWVFRDQLDLLQQLVNFPLRFLQTLVSNKHVHHRYPE